MINRRLSCLCFEIVFILRLVVSVLNELNSSAEQLSMFHYFFEKTLFITLRVTKQYL